MTNTLLDTIPQEAVDVVRRESGGCCSDDNVRTVLAAALPHLVAKRDAEIARLTGLIKKFDGQDDDLRETLLERNARIKVLEAALSNIQQIAEGDSYSDEEVPLANIHNICFATLEAAIREGEINDRG